MEVRSMSSPQCLSCTTQHGEELGPVSASVSLPPPPTGSLGLHILGETGRSGLSFMFSFLLCSDWQSGPLGSPLGHVLDNCHSSTLSNLLQIEFMD